MKALNSLWTHSAKSVLAVLFLILAIPLVASDGLKIQFVAGFTEIETWENIGIYQKKYEPSRFARYVQAGSRYTEDYRVYFPDSDTVKELQEIRQFYRNPNADIFVQTALTKKKVYGTDTNGFPIVDADSVTDFGLSTTRGLHQIGLGMTTEVIRNQKLVYRGDMIFLIDASEADYNYRVFFTFAYLKNHTWVYFKLRRIVKAGTVMGYRPTLAEASDAADTDVQYFIYNNCESSVIGIGATE